MSQYQQEWDTIINIIILKAKIPSKKALKKLLKKYLEKGDFKYLINNNTNCTTKNYINYKFQRCTNLVSWQPFANWHFSFNFFFLFIVHAASPHILQMILAICWKTYFNRILINLNIFSALIIVNFIHGWCDFMSSTSKHIFLLLGSFSWKFIFWTRK